METKLDRLLAWIEARKTIDETSNRADEAINSFELKCAQITNWDQFRLCIARFMQHLDVCILKLLRPIEMIDFYWGKGVMVLAKLYGPQGEKAAFEMARTGNDGGLYEVLKAVAQFKAEEYGGNEIYAKASAYWNSLSLDEKLRAPDEYIAKYGHLLPSELTEGSAARIRVNFINVLTQHVHLTRTLKNNLRRLSRE